MFEVHQLSQHQLSVISHGLRCPTNPSMHQTRQLLVSHHSTLLISPSGLIPFSGHPHLEKWKAVGKKYKQCWHGTFREEEDEEREERNRGFSHSRAKKTSRIQVLRSVSDWSHGVLTEHSIQDACEFRSSERFLI